jgi:ACS family hexuronate transporter-like MFS transporter
MAKKTVLFSKTDNFNPFLNPRNSVFFTMKQTKIGNYRWVICALLFFATTINYIDRQILGLLKPTLETEFNWTETDYANIVMVFAGCYALGYIVFGNIIDKIGSKLGYSISIIIWSVAAILHALVKALSDLER